MKFAFVSINAKYIHTSPAVRILSKIVEPFYDSTFFEFSIKDTLEHIISILDSYDYIFLSCYIWNIEMMKELSKELRMRRKIVVSGGPEVTYDFLSFIEDFDYIMLGEGEEIILPLIDHLLDSNKEIPSSVVSIDKKYGDVYYTKDLNNVPDILDTYTKEDMLNRIIYVETSRGCPFNCSYCLSSLEEGVRFFSDERIEKLFNFIENNKFKCLKFLDRTFNVNPKRFLSFLRRLEKTENTYQFEIEANIFNDEIIDYFVNEVTPNKFRLEIGIQSLNSDSIKACNRHQNKDEIINTIKKIKESNRVVIHADLIAGLPFEDISSFKNTFNETFALRIDELQLGFLKMLRGTKIRNEKDLFSYEFDNNAPYEVRKNKFMSNEDIIELHKVEESLEWMWNNKRCINLINHLFIDYPNFDFYSFFLGYFSYYNKFLPLHDNYLSLLKYLKDIGIYKIDYLYDLKLDFLTKSRVKPMPFWRDKSKNNYLEKEYDFELLGLNEEYRNSFITDYYDKYLIIKYVNGKAPILEIKELFKIEKRHKAI